MAIESRPVVQRSTAPRGTAPAARTTSGDAGQTPSSAARIVSLDQFRGYTVAGMFVVNFLGMYSVVHFGLKHNPRFLTWADTIMPSFMFICGVSYRLSIARRLAQKGAASTYFGIIRRSLGLVLVSMAMYGAEDFGGFKAWAEINPGSIKHAIAQIIKADLWETLAIIGMTQILLIPFIGKSFRVRVAAMIGFSVLHVLISYWFNYWFVNGKPNWMDTNVFGLEGSRAWDGGCFGLISWGVPMLAGSLVYDVLNAKGPARSIAPLLATGVLLMGVGWGLSCGSRLYDVREGATVDVLEADPNFAASPVLPLFENAKGRPVADLLGDPPFLQIPGPDQRKINYWMMDKRMPSQSFMLFATGFGMALYALFIVVCDAGGLALPLFRTLGTNALAAYAIHHAIEALVQQFVPEDAPVAGVVGGLIVFFLITWSMVRFLEKNKLFIRL